MLDSSDFYTNRRFLRFGVDVARDGYCVFILSLQLILTFVCTLYVYSVGNSWRKVVRVFLPCCDYAELQSASFKYLGLIYLRYELLDIENSLSFTVMNFKYFVK